MPRLTRQKPIDSAEDITFSYGGTNTTQFSIPSIPVDAGTLFNRQLGIPYSMGSRGLIVITARYNI